MFPARNPVAKPKLRATPRPHCIAAEMFPGNAKTLLHHSREAIVTVPSPPCIAAEASL
jgi:hypothetical protein